MTLKKRTPHQILNISEQASQVEIETAYQESITILNDSNNALYMMMDAQSLELERKEIESAYLQLKQNPRTSKGKKIKRQKDKKKSRRRKKIKTIVPKETIAPTEQKPELYEDDNELEITLEKKVQLSSVRFLKPVYSTSEPSTVTKNKSTVTKTTAALTQQEKQPSNILTEKRAQHSQILTLADEMEINGHFIMQRRQELGLSIEDLIKKTHIRRVFIEAIENSNPAELPKKVYLRGFLTQIARILKINRTELALRYIQTLEKKGIHLP